MLNIQHSLNVDLISALLSVVLGGTLESVAFQALIHVLAQSIPNGTNNPRF